VKSMAFLLLTASVLSAQQPQQPKPFGLSFGPQENGTFGAVIKGSQFKSLRRAPSEKQSGQLLSVFAGVEIDGSWNSATDARNNTSIALRPAFALQTITPRVVDGKTMPTTAGPWLYAYLDIRQRFGDFENAAAEQRRLNQLILGGALQFRWAGFAKWYRQAADVGREDNPPTLSIGYYTVQRNEPEDEPLPPDVVADAMQAKLNTGLTLPICTKETREVPRTADDPFGSTETVYDCPWSFMGELLATKLTGGGRDFDFRYDVGVIYDTGGSFKPILRFRSGEEHGLEYDRIFLLGLLWALPI
jgi:hypothetical protein